MTTFFNKKTRFDEDICVRTYNSTNTIPELTGYEHNMIPRGADTNNRYIDVPECPNPELTEIEYINKRYSRTIRGLDMLTKKVLKDDILYGKSTVVTQRMVKPSLRDKEFDKDDSHNYVYWSSCYKGLHWARLQYICEKWGVNLIEAPPYEK